MEKVFGIDLGTTYSCISYIDDNGQAVVVPNAEGEYTTPSVVYYESPDQVTVGTEAKNMLAFEPNKTIAFMKRSIGKSDKSGNPIMYPVEGQELSPQQISAQVLKKLVGDANMFLHGQGLLEPNEEIKDVVITCPAYFKIKERMATKEAGELAGLNVLDIINEPTAAAVNYGLLNKDKDKRVVLVYDLGGGTFDVTIIQINKSQIDVVYSDGDRNLGGKDWDSVLTEYLAAEFERQTGLSDVLLDEEVYNDFIGKAEDAKKSLSSAKGKAKVGLNVDGKRAQIEITREQFDQMTAHLLQSTLDKVDACIRGSLNSNYNIALGDIDEILLVGGSTRMPQIAEKLKEKYVKEVSLFDPDQAVSKGAALFAKVRKDYEVNLDAVAKDMAEQTGIDEQTIKDEINSGKTTDQIARERDATYDGPGMALSPIKISDTISKTYGTKTVRDSNPTDCVVTNILKRGVSLPATQTMSFYTVGEGQKGVSIEIYETDTDEDQMELADAIKIGEAALEFPKAMPKGTGVNITLKMDNSGLLTVIGEEESTNSRIEKEFRPD